MASKRIIGIDPGTNVLGFAVIDTTGQQIQVVTMGVIRMQHFDSHQDKLLHIFQSVAKMILTHRPQEMAVEAPFYGKNVQSMLKLGRAQGVAIAAALTREIRVHEYSPKKIKQAITGSGNASKEQVAAMLKHLVQGDINYEMLDATDALATAICHAQRGAQPGGKKKHYADWKSFARENPDVVSGQ
ncbi:MAG: crossover junction endodeoxyribonuclease RuvC [Saprospiraceae bacterium]|nr:crossover junction endodeoxyribonuclease RuvC [Saprospiraceae bacterium]